VNREKLEQTVRKLIEDRNARSLGERSEVYSAARKSVRRATNEELAILADTDEVIDEVEASYAPRQQPIKQDGSNRRGGAKPVLFGLVGGAILGGLAAAAVMVFGLRFQPYTPVAATLVRQYNATVPLVPAAVDYLNKVAAAIVEMQKKDPAALEAKASSKLVGITSVDPELAKNLPLPRSMPPGSTVIIRANRSDYKILLNWTLCTAVRFTKPEMVDPARAPSKDMVGCSYFGLWTPGAVKW
jgi:hypothetical protein